MYADSVLDRVKIFDHSPPIQNLLFEAKILKIAWSQVKPIPLLLGQEFHYLFRGRIRVPDKEIGSLRRFAAESRDLAPFPVFYHELSVEW